MNALGRAPRTDAPLDAVPRVSIILPFYNAERFLEEAIDSVMLQTHDAFELLLIDDGSTDGATAIAKAAARNDPVRVRYLKHPDHANRGTAASRNLGLSEARGEYAAFIDADDRWRPAKLREQMAILDRRPDLDAVCGSANFWRSFEGGKDAVVPTGHVQNQAVRPPSAILELYPLGKANAPVPSDLMLRLSAAQRVGGFEESFRGDLQLYEDQTFFSKLYLTATILFTDRVWIDYRLHDRSCSSIVEDAGRYDYVRGHFLNWLEQYLSTARTPVTAAVRFALWRAQLPYRHPALGKARSIKRLLGRKLTGR